ncbi:protein transport protein bet1 [Basidiobolus ranarum]|uniref:Protein transport protein bet1 n=1 Tax=Basidiobolus ranarum TaxID=34480 RepID=A0ABR2WSM4_9FUNG
MHRPRARQYANQQDYNQQGQDYTQNELENMNEQRIEGLSDKVSLLREITLNIGDEVRDQNAYLKDMGSDFERTGTYLKGTMRRFYAMAQTQSGRYMIYLILFALLVFTFMLLYVRWRN